MKNIGTTFAIFVKFSFESSPFFSRSVQHAEALLLLLPLLDILISVLGTTLLKNKSVLDLGFRTKTAKKLLITLFTVKTKELIQFLLLLIALQLSIDVYFLISGRPNRASIYHTHSRLGAKIMKFGKQLQLGTYEPWKDYYIQYSKLKRIIKRRKFVADKHRENLRVL